MSDRYNLPNPQHSCARLIPDKVALIGDQRDIESLPFHLSFEYYNDKLCEIEYLEKNVAKRTLNNLRTIGGCNNKTLKQNGIDAIPVSNLGEYLKLYSKLPPDADVKEHKISGTARIFYFIVSRIFYLVCFKNSHFETGKHRN